MTPSPFPSDFLLGPGPAVKVSRIDFAATAIPEYKDDYAVVLDDVLTPAECATLVRAAEASAGGKWERALVNVGGNEQEYLPDRRDCDRIIWDDRELVARLWARVRPHVPELMRVKNAPRLTGMGPVRRGEVYGMTRLNERMRFLRYGPFEYFSEHYDGMYITPDGSERCFYTLHVYLNESKPENKLIGGATTFHSRSMELREHSVYPKAGRILIFQQRDMLHSGQEVLEGVKLTLRTDLMYTLV